TSTKTAYTPSENKPEFFKKDDKTIHSLALGGLIGVDFYAYIPETGFEDCSVTFKIGDEEQTVTVSDTVDHAEYTHPDYTDTFHRFTCRITSVQMADEITATLNYTAANAQGANVGDGPEPFTVEGDTDSFSAVKYLDAVLADGSGASANLIALAKAIKDYGYYAQQSLADYHGWTIGDEETNAHKAITKSDDAEITVNDVTANTLSTNKITITRSKAENSSFGEVTYSLLLDDEVEIELNVPYTGQADTVTATIDGTALTNNPVKNADNVYTINTGGIPAHLLGTAKGIVLTAGTGDEAETCTVSVSGYSYVHSVLSQSGDDNKATDGYTLSKLKQAVIALYKYGQAAVTYNTSPNN
ncbi:MAG: hypothetical protein IJG37_08320, partial [Synergistaceae bacterium]|nr:hypothetical protein [Synergistaceae bacterium]